jgi:hypothetical protein
VVIRWLAELTPRSFPAHLHSSRFEGVAGHAIYGEEERGSAIIRNRRECVIERDYKQQHHWVSSQSLHSKTQSWTLILTVVAALCDVLLSLPFYPLCCCLCPIMFVPRFVLLPCCVATMLLSCCVATMLCCHVLLPCYVVVLGLSLCSVVSLVVMCPIFIYISMYLFGLIPGPVPAGLFPFGRPPL